MRLKEQFPTARFAPPASEEQIARTEAELGLRFPETLRALYQECDGFREPRGNAQYLFPLSGNDSSVVTITKFWWRDWPEIVAPRVPIDFTPFVFFGSSSADEVWGMRWSGSNEIIAYHHNMEDRFEVLGTDILSVYHRDYALYDEAPQ